MSWFWIWNFVEHCTNQSNSSETDTRLYASSGIQSNLQALTGADSDNTEYLYFANQLNGMVHDRAVFVNVSTKASLVIVNKTDEHAANWAYFGNGINPQGGVIIADNNQTPRRLYGQTVFFPISRIVQSSQAAWGKWEYLAAANVIEVPSLRFVIRSWVTNTETQNQIVEALRGMGRTTLSVIENRVGF